MLETGKKCPRKRVHVLPEKSKIVLDMLIGESSPLLMRGSRFCGHG
jgi:hypothetical protein